jgi:hypothetical protein
MLSWPSTSCVAQFVDPNVMSADEHEPLQEGYVSKLRYELSKLVKLATAQPKTSSS